MEWKLYIIQPIVFYFLLKNMRCHDVYCCRMIDWWVVCTIFKKYFFITFYLVIIDFHTKCCWIHIKQYTQKFQYTEVLYIYFRNCVFNIFLQRQNLILGFWYDILRFLWVGTLDTNPYQVANFASQPLYYK